LQKIENRLVSTQGKKNNLIINDSYSNDLSAFEIALDYLNTQSTNKSKVLIFSDFDIKPELIEANISKLKSILNSQHFDTIIAIGPWLGQNKATLPKGISFFENRHELIKDGILQTIQNAAILIKGARKFELEKLSKMLEREVHQTQLRINLTAIKNNVKYYQSLLQPNTKTMAMVKALGYGTGGHEIAKALQSTGIDYLGVAFAREAQELRENGIDLPIMVLNASMDEIMAYQELKLEPVVYNIQQIKDLKENSAIGELGIHIELDSGMHRLGFDEDDFQSILDLLPPRFKVKSIFSHLASSENSANDDFTNKQTSKLEVFASNLSNGLGYKPLIHLANTAGTQRHPSTHFDMVRLGIGMYGIPSVNEKLDTAVSLVSQITQIKTVPANEGIGYGLRNPSNKNRQIAIIPIGYADGLMRILNNEGKNGNVFINGEFAAIVGNICMDMTMIDVTGLKVYEGDEVELFGKHISMQSVAEKCETIPYEILTRISVRVKRVYTEK